MWLTPTISEMHDYIEKLMLWLKLDTENVGLRSLAIGEVGFRSTMFCRENLLVVYQSAIEDQNKKNKVYHCQQGTKSAKITSAKVHHEQFELLLWKTSHPP